MVRIMECATSRCLLVIPDDSHVWVRMAEAREQARAAKRRSPNAKNGAREPVTPKGVMTAS